MVKKTNKAATPCSIDQIIAGIHLSYFHILKGSLVVHTTKYHMDPGSIILFPNEDNEEQYFKITNVTNHNLTIPPIENWNILSTLMCAKGITTEIIDSIDVIELIGVSIGE